MRAALDREPADLMVCPELFMSGYDAGVDLAARAGATDGADLDTDRVPRAQARLPYVAESARLCGLLQAPEERD